MSTTTTLSLSSFVALASYAPAYEQARSGNGLVESEWPWVGQYRAADQFEINQVAVAFDLSGVTGGLMSASLAITVDESYGNTTLEVREHDWPPGTTAFVPGADLGSKRLLGSVQIGPGGRRDVTISLAPFDLSKTLKFILAIADQRLGVEPTGDTTLLVSDARLSVTTAIITTPGAGTWTVPAGVTEVTVECWGGGGAGRYGGGGGGGGWSSETLTVTQGQSFNYFIAAIQPYSESGDQTIGQDTWFGSTSTVLAKGATGHIGGQASAGHGAQKFSGGSARYQDPNTGLPGEVGESTYGGSGASASKNGEGGDSFYNPMTGTGTGGASPGAGAIGQAHVEGGGGSASIGSGGAPGGGSRAAPSTRGQIRITWAAGPVEPEPGDTTPPTITSPASAEVAENTVNPTGTLSANEPVTWSIAGGADAAMFSISGSTWTLNATPDYEVKSTYSVVFRAADAAGNSTDWAFTLTITDVNEQPQIEETVVEKFKTPGTYLWTVPAGVTSVTAQVWGPGGKGGDGVAGVRGGGGGGGGGYRQATDFPVSAGQSIQIRVGSSGTSSFFLSSAVCDAWSGQASTGQGPGAGGGHAGSAAGFGHGGGAGNWGGGGANANGGSAGSSAAPIGPGSPNGVGVGEQRGQGGQYGIGRNTPAGAGQQPGGGGGGGSASLPTGGAGGAGQVFLTYTIFSAPPPVRRALRSFYWL